VTLSPRELEVIRLYARGLSRADIAEQLGISPRTFEVHLANAKEKLGLADQVAVIRHALRAGWMTVQEFVGA
jgi:DNA-binding NarL/FixJ family response regulator